MIAFDNLKQEIAGQKRGDKKKQLVRKLSFAEFRGIPVWLQINYPTHSPHFTSPKSFLNETGFLRKHLFIHTQIPGPYVFQSLIWINCRCKMSSPHHTALSFAWMSENSETQKRGEKRWAVNKTTAWWQCEGKIQLRNRGFFILITVEWVLACK